MPLPMPHSGESQEDFIHRCLADPATQDIAGDNAETSQRMRVAACFRQWREEKSDAGVETKSCADMEIKDADRGEVRAVIARFNVVDKDKDVTLPEAIADGTKVRISPYNHSSIQGLSRPVGRGVIHVDGDKAVLEAKFFMSTVEGRESFQTVKEMADLQEWSYGYHVLERGELTDDLKQQGARRVLSKLHVIEASPVMIGAGVDTMTLSVKAETPKKTIDGTAHPREDFAYAPGDNVEDWKLPIFDADHVRNALARFNQTEGIPDDARDGVMRKLRAAAERFGIDAASLDEKKSAEAEAEAKAAEEAKAKVAAEEKARAERMSIIADSLERVERTRRRLGWT